MKNSTKNPVISEAEANAISVTFGSVLPLMPISMLNHEDVAKRSLENENSKENEVDKLAKRAVLTKRSAELLETQVAGRWANFGVPTTGLMYTPLPDDRGIQISLKNHRGEVVKCNLRNKFGKDNTNLASDIQTAMEIATLTNSNISFHTAPSGNWKSTEWFAQAYVTLTPKKVSK
jgi:hypothetical protein